MSCINKCWCKCHYCIIGDCAFCSAKDDCGCECFVNKHHKETDCPECNNKLYKRINQNTVVTTFECYSCGYWDTDYRNFNIFRPPGERQ